MDRLGGLTTMLRWQRRQELRIKTRLSLVTMQRAALREGRVRQLVEIRAQGSAGAEAVYQASGPGEDNTSIGRK